MIANRGRSRALRLPSGNPTMILHLDGNGTRRESKACHVLLQKTRHSSLGKRSIATTRRHRAFSVGDSAV